MTKITTCNLIKMKQQGEKIAMLTAYDATFAQTMNAAGVDVLLVGDTLGTVIHGHQNTIPVTMDDVVYHMQAVSRGNSRALLIGDMPFMSFSDPQQTLANAARLMQAGAHMIKFEGGAWLVETTKLLTERGIPVCGHGGLTPQSLHKFGGHKIQGRSEQQAQQLINDAKQLEQAGAQMLVLECVPQQLASEIANLLTIPVIGIGAGPGCDGQVLVLHDMLGLGNRKLTFCKDFLSGQTQGILGAFQAYVQQVKHGDFPTLEHSFE